MADEPDAVPRRGEKRADAPARRALAASVRTAVTATTGREASSIVARGPSRAKSAPAASTRDALCITSSWLVRVREHDGIHAALAHELRELLLGAMGMPAGRGAGERGRYVRPSIPSDLGRGESDDPDGVVLAEHGVEVVEVATAGSHDHHPAHTRIGTPRGAGGIGVPADRRGGNYGLRLRTPPRIASPCESWTGPSSVCCPPFHGRSSNGCPLPTSRARPSTTPVGPSPP